MKLFKKNQVIIYAIALMLMTAGYLNYTANNKKANSVETSIQMEAKDDTQLADIGDAKLVNSNDVESGENNKIQENITNTASTENSNNTINTTNVEGTTDLVGPTDSTNENQKGSENTVNSTETSANKSNEYFVKSKLERDTMYSQMIESYEKILNSSNSLETQKQTATQEITKINETKNKIMICENLIKTKGFEDSIIFVNGSSVSVIIGAKEIKPEEIAQVQNIISREMGVGIENIHISNK